MTSYFYLGGSLLIVCFALWPAATMAATSILAYAALALVLPFCPKPPARH